MLKKIISSLIIATMFVSSSFGAYKYIGQIDVGETIEGYGDRNYNGLEYDMVVAQYSLVEFFPETVGIDSVHYLIQDYDNMGSYFYTSNGTGISSFGSTSYPDGFKIHLMPGTYKVIVNAFYDNTEYRMGTTSAVTINQTPPTQKIIYTTGEVYDPISIETNIKYHDNIGFDKDIREGIESQNIKDFFYFTLSSKSDVTIYAKLLDDFLESASYKSMTFSIKEKSITGTYTNSCSSLTVKTEDTSGICTLEAGTYRLETYPSNYTSGSYDFSINSELFIETPTCTSTQTLEDNVCVDNDVPITTPTCTTTQTLVDNVCVDNTTTIVTESTETQIIGNITFLMYEPDGYFSWSEANSWCTERGYRLPTMDELIASWVASGSNISPTGFEKDTFYWASDSLSYTEHKGCAMDYDCSEESSWSDDSYGHPKCVVSVGSAFITTPTTELDIEDETPSVETPTEQSPIYTDEETSSGGGAFGYIIPLFALILLYFRREL